VYLGYDTTSPYSKIWNSTTIADGPHKVKVQAVDWANNSRWDEVSIHVNNP
jgi:hypothetical protein